MQAVFMGKTMHLPTVVLVMPRSRVVVFEKPEVIDKTG